jgi:ribosomal protein S18 acetylase RimI-like enzyme
MELETGAGDQTGGLPNAGAQSSGRSSQIEIRAGSRSDAAAAASLHTNQITEGFLASLGPRFLDRLYRRIALQPESFLVVADAGSPTLEQAGFLAGSLDVRGLYKEFLVRDAAVAAIVSAPRLLRALPRAAETLRHGSSDKTQPGTAELLAVAVDPDWRGRGVGGLLVERFLDTSRARGAAVAQVVVGAQNAPAVTLYRRAGFEPTETFELHRGTTSILMKRAC